MNIYSLGDAKWKKKSCISIFGGLDTSVAIKWLQEKNYDIIALCLDLGKVKT